MFTKFAKYHLGQVVRHKKHPFRGVVFDVDPVEHPDVRDLFGPFKDGHYPLYFHLN